MNNFPVVVVDADAIIASENVNDVHHQKAMKIVERLTSSHAQILYPTTAIAEAATHMQRVLSDTERAYNTVSLMTKIETQVIDVGKQTLAEAMHYFSPKTSKKNTIFDCIVAAVARQQKADAIFSFDHFYKKHGFTLAEDL